MVAKDVPDYALIVGNPSRQIGWICECGNRVFFEEAPMTVCDVCRREYVKEDGRVRQK